MKPGLFLPLVLLAALPAQAQQKAYTLTMDGGVASPQPITRAQLKSQLASKLRIRKIGNDTVRARLVMILARDGKPQKVYISQDFALPGGENPLPPGVFPGGDWLPDGASGGTPAAFGWFPDWLNRLLGLSTEPQTIDPNSNEAADAYWLAEEKRAKDKRNSAMTGGGANGLMAGPPPGAGMATLSMIVLPVTGPGAATAGVQGVSVTVGR
ncbi:MAG: hypothetical protein HOP28_01990 [Gemmatimonadales bacterium]|nr:hypothetical protein [Gemmatimonadales bacterium]